MVDNSRNCSSVSFTCVSRAMASFSKTVIIFYLKERTALIVPWQPIIRLLGCSQTLPQNQPFSQLALVHLVCYSAIAPVWTNCPIKTTSGRGDFQTDHEVV